MRLLEMYEQLLLEHNVVNADAIKRYVSQFASQCHNENAREWFNTVLARHLEKDDHLNVRMTDQNIPRNAPAWLDAAIARGDDLRVFNVPSHLTTSFEHLVDYMNYLADHEDPVIENRDRIMKVTVPQAVTKSEEWSSAEAKKAAQTEATDMKLIHQDGGFKWVEPQTLDALHRDGKILHICTGNGTYDRQFTSKSMRFFILYDSKNQPHVCISVHYSGKTMEGLDQVKGKQNKAPIGRYARLCANFLNWLKPSAVGSNTDVKNMGLVLNAQGQLTTIVEASGTVVYTIGGVRVYETTGATQHVAGDYGGGSVSLTGVDYWFNSSEGDLFRIKVADGKAYLNLANTTVPVPTIRHLVQQFMNNYFPDGAPPPLSTRYGSSTVNNLQSSNDGGINLKLRYNALNKKYGSYEEVGELKFEVDGCRAYLWGQEHYSRIQREIFILRGDETLFGVPLGSGNDETITSLNVWSHSMRDSEAMLAIKPVIVATLNEIGVPPQADISQHSNKWREKLNLYYSKEKNLWGSYEEVCAKLWERGPYSLWKRNEIGLDYFMMMKKNQCQPVFFIEPEGNLRVFGDVLSTKTNDRDDDTHEVDKGVVPKLLLTVLNSVSDLGFMKTVANDGSLDEYDIFLVEGQPKWQSRASAGQLFHKFDDGSYFTKIGRGSSDVYNLYGPTDKGILAVTVEGGDAEGFALLDGSILSASRQVLWLFNEIHVDGIDTVDGGGYYYGKNESTQPKPVLWKLGMFYDTRGEQWKLIQDGKLLHDGGTYRAINFRNRVFLMDNHDGLLGWFKKDGHLIGEKQSFGNERAFLSALEDLIDNTSFYMTRGNEHHEDRHRENGFFWHKDENKSINFRDSEKLWPQKTVLKLPKGYEWINKSVDKTFHDAEKEETPHGQSYSLVDSDGKSFMRANFDDDHLKNVRFSTKGSMDNYALTSDLKEMKDGPQKKAFLALLEKLNKKLTPTQVAEIGWYRTKTGAYKSLASKPILSAYFKGKIDFGDGHIFKRESHRRKKNDYANDYETVTSWELGTENPDAEYHHEKFKAYLRVILDDEGIDSVQYLKKEVKRQPKEYMPYIHKLMQIFSTISGE